MFLHKTVLLSSLKTATKVRTETRKNRDYAIISQLLKCIQANKKHESYKNFYQRLTCNSVHRTFRYFLTQFFLHLPTNPPSASSLLFRCLQK